MLPLVGLGPRTGPCISWQDWELRSDTLRAPDVRRWCLGFFFQLKQWEIILGSTDTADVPWPFFQLVLADNKARPFFYSFHGSDFINWYLSSLRRVAGRVIVAKCMVQILRRLRQIRLDLRSRLILGEVVHHEFPQF
jgi:hypothetical protein